MRKKNSFFIIIFLIMLAVFISISCHSADKDAKLEMSPVFGDHMVLQQKQKIPVWGICRSNAKISVKFREQIHRCRADEKGKWRIDLEPLIPGAPDSMVIESDHLRKVFKNVQVGEVWFCSGQSNMQMNVACTWAKIDHSEEEVAGAHFPDIRLLIVERMTSFTPLDTLSSEGWKVCSPETVRDFSAVAYFFGREIHLSQNVPVGLIQAAWGGTVAEAWTSGESLKLMADFAGIANKIERIGNNRDSLQLHYKRDYQEWLLETAMADAGIKEGDTIFTGLDFDDSDWTKIKVPGYWEETKIGELDGTLWYRKKVQIPAKLLGKNLTLSLGPPDDADETWFNGFRVGESKIWNVVRKYNVPAHFVKAGENVITVRLSDYMGSGGFMGREEDFMLSCYDGWKLKISNEWRCRVGYDQIQIKTIPLKPDEPNIPTVLFNAMVNPVIPFAIRGVIWYQGESNTGKAYQYRELFPLLITDWRKNWNQGDFPFLFVQLANYLGRNTSPVEDAWAELREAQAKALDLANTGMAVTIDIGNAKNIHPSNKQDVGRRLALIARNRVYKENIPYSGPVFMRMKKDGNKIILDFDHAYDGLKISDGSGILKGFSIAGNDRIFYWAKAKIVDNKIVVSSEKVREPQAVRYAWNSNPECNLSNSADLPASPFRTDNWPGLFVNQAEDKK